MDIYRNIKIILQGDSDQTSKYWFSPIKEPSEIVIFASMLMIFSFVFVKLKFKMDFSGILTLLLHLIVAVQRLVNDFIFVTEELNNNFQVLGNGLIWISLYYFTFEMMIIKSTLAASSYQELKKAKRKITI
jgi:hypothetical protein